MPNDSQNNTLQSNTFDHSIQHESKGELKHDASPSLFGPAVSKAAGGQHSEHNASPGFNNFLYQFATRTKLDDRGSDVMRNRKSPYQTKAFRQKNLRSERNVGSNVVVDDQLTLQACLK